MTLDPLSPDLLHPVDYEPQALLLRLKTHPAELRCDPVPARVLPRLQPPRPPHHRGIEGLVGRWVGQYPVRVYPRLVAEGVVAHYRLVGLDHYAGQAGHKPGGLVEERVVDVGPPAVEVEASERELLQ